MYRKLKENGFIVPSEYCYHRSRLSKAEQVAYDTICRAVSRHKDSVDLLPSPGLDVQRVINAMDYDQSMFYFLNVSVMRFVNCVFSVHVMWDFRLSKTETADINGRLLARLNQLRLPGSGTELSREVRLHDIAMDMGITTQSGSWKSHCILGPMLEGQTVCEGFSHMFRLLCLLCGVYCICISGSGDNGIIRGPHMWNMVRLGDTFAHVDAYWDALHYDKTGMCVYTYFNLGDQQAMLDHTWETAYYPGCPREKYSYFAMNNAEVDSAAAFVEKWRSMWGRGKRGIIVRLGTNVSPSECVTEILNMATRGSSIRLKHSFDEKQRVLMARVELGAGNDHN